VTLAASDVDPHVAQPNHQIRISREPQPHQVKQGRGPLVRYRHVDVLESDDVAGIAARAVVRSLPFLNYLCAPLTRAVLISRLDRAVSDIVPHLHASKRICARSRRRGSVPLWRCGRARSRTARGRRSPRPARRPKRCRSETRGNRFPPRARPRKSADHVPLARRVGIAVRREHQPSAVRGSHSDSTLSRVPASACSSSTSRSLSGAG